MAMSKRSSAKSRIRFGQLVGTTTSLAPGSRPGAAPCPRRNRRNRLFRAVAEGLVVARGGDAQHALSGMRSRRLSCAWRLALASSARQARAWTRWRNDFGMATPRDGGPQRLRKSAAAAKSRNAGERPMTPGRRPSMRQEKRKKCAKRLTPPSTAVHPAAIPGGSAAASPGRAPGRPGS